MLLRSGLASALYGNRVLHATSASNVCPFICIVLLYTHRWRVQRHAAPCKKKDHPALDNESYGESEPCIIHVSRRAACG